jgi:hypothetical protein
MLMSLVTGGKNVDREITSLGDKKRRAVESLIMRAYEAEQDALRKSSRLTEEGFGGALEGIDEQSRLTGVAQREARRTSKDEGLKAQALMRSRFGGSRAGTTAYDNAYQDVGARITRQLADVDARFGGVFSQLAGTRGDVMAQRGGALASIEGEKGQSKAAWLRTLADLENKRNPYQKLNNMAAMFDPAGLGGKLDSEGNYGGGNLGSVLTTLLSIYLGGLGGAAVGAAGKGNKAGGKGGKKG